ncbi:RHS repeat protein, partial [Salmonella enterica subsp. salamae]|nr:RHS repeat protein [Salmonella enterica subsp. salamae]
MCKFLKIPKYGMVQICTSTLQYGLMDVFVYYRNNKEYEYNRFGQMTAVHREEGLSVYRSYNSRGQLTAIRDSLGR